MKRDLERGGDGREAEGLPSITIFPPLGDYQAVQVASLLSMVRKRSESQETPGCYSAEGPEAI